MRGYSLIECVCALGITSLLAAVATSFVHSSAVVLGEHNALLDQRISVMKSALVISTSIHSLERGHIPGLVSVTHGDSLSTSIGGVSPTSGLSANSRPRTDSDILSSIQIDPRYRGRVLKSSFNSTSITLEVCELQNVPAKDQFRSYLGLGVQGTCQLVGSPQASGDHCVSLSGTLIRGLINDTPCDPASLLELVPVAREFSVFIDRGGELRLISHVGLRILENQPITRGLRSLTVQERQDPSGAVIYTLTLRPTSSRPTSFQLVGGLTQEPRWNDILL